MRYEFYESNRHKIPNAKFRVINRPVYDAALVRRGSLMVRLIEEAIAALQAPTTGERDCQPIYATSAIKTSPPLSLVFYRPV